MKIIKTKWFPFGRYKAINLFGILFTKGDLSEIDIDYLKRNNLLTKDKAKAFRDAMKYVGGVSIPVTIGTSTQR